jgi:hypothetical protein
MDIFLAAILKERAATNHETDSGAQKLEGHILIRMEPGGGEFYVIVIENTDESFRVKEKFRPYTSR